MKNKNVKLTYRTETSWAGGLPESRRKKKSIVFLLALEESEQHGEATLAWYLQAHMCLCVI